MLQMFTDALTFYTLVFGLQYEFLPFFLLFFLWLLNCLVINFILNMISFFFCFSWLLFRYSCCAIHVIYYHRKTNVIYLFVALVVSFHTFFENQYVRSFTVVLFCFSLIQWHFNTFRSFGLLQILLVMSTVLATAWK